MKCNNSTLFTDLEIAIRDEFRDIVLSNTSIDIFWKDNTGEWIGIKTKNGLIIALEEQGGPNKLHDIVIQVNEDGNNGSLYKNIANFERIVA